MPGIQSQMQIPIECLVFNNDKNVNTGLENAELSILDEKMGS